MKLTTSIATLGVLFSGIAGVLLDAGVASAVSPTEFQPGRIIDDGIFYDKDAMGGAANVQNFINNHTPACDTWGTQPSGYGGTRAQYAASMGWHGPPYVCLQNYHENPSTGETSFEKGGGAFTGGQSAGKIIWDAAQAHGINPQVLLVMLKKESAGPLFSDSWPLKSQYKYAMGYACPDSGPNYSANCESSKAGFYNQINLAAWQLRRYANYIHEYNYQPNRWNYIQHSPNPACGGQNVYIENVATASLYIYTPYVPTSAALNAYPGTVNCGAYGNRNFFMFFNEWFGSTLLNNQLVRTMSNDRVYLIVENKKYPILGEEMLGQLRSIGGVGFVSQSYLDTLETGSAVKRLVRNPNDGSIYLIDSGIKIKFGSCELVADYGYGCAEAVNLTPSQLNTFATGPAVTNFFNTTNGKRFYIKGGQRREIYDDQSMQAAGLGGFANRLTESAIASLPYGIPVANDDIFIRERNKSNSLFIRSAGAVSKIDPEITQKLTQLSSSAKTLDGASIQQIGNQGTSIRGVVKDSTNTYVLTSAGKMRVNGNANLGAMAVPLSTAAIGKIEGSLATEYAIVRTSGNPNLYYLEAPARRPLNTWNDVFSLDKAPKIVTIFDTTMGLFSNGNAYIRPGEMIKSASSAMVYVTLGRDTVIALGSFDQTTDLNIKGSVRTVPQQFIDAMTKRSGFLGNRIQCGTDKFRAIGSSGLFRVSDTESGTYTVFENNYFCQESKIASQPHFVKTKTSDTIYRISDNMREPISSWASFTRYGGNNDNISEITQSGLNSFELGPGL